MPDKKFPGPNINHLIEEDRQIVKVPMEKMDIGARSSTMGKTTKDKNIGTIQHVGREK